MIGYVVRRLLIMIPTLLAISLIVFVIIELPPGDYLESYVAELVFTIGIVNSTLQPVVINNRLRNVPAEGIYAWNPGAYFGIYKPDTFWFAGNTKER